MRPGLMIGMSVGGAIGVYAAVLKERGEPLYYPGEGLAVTQSTDADLIAQACKWVLLEPRARNQCYNLDNGEFASLKERWEVFAEALGMRSCGEKPFNFVQGLPEFDQEWNQIREKYKLKSPAIEPFLGQSGQFSNFVLARGNRAPTSMSCIKIRQHGFGGTLYTDVMIRKWFKAYQNERLLPGISDTNLDAKLS